MRYQFPRSLKVAETARSSAELGQWALGDALLVESDGKLGGPRGLKAVARELKGRDLDFTASYLQSLRYLAQTFSSNRRHGELPWKVHEAAGNPDTLDVIVRSARKSGDKVTIWYVYDVLKHQRDELKRRRAEAHGAAADMVAAAEREERAARNEERQATDIADRRQARLRREAAEERRRKAQDSLKKQKTLPRKIDRPAPHEDEVPLLVMVTRLTADASTAEALALSTEKILATGLEDLSPVKIAALTEAAMSVANAWTRVAALLRTAPASTKRHLSVVNE